MKYACTKAQLVEQFTMMLSESKPEERWGYVWGAQGELYNKWLAEKWKNDPSRGVPSSSWNKETYYTKDCAKWYGHRVADCSGSFIAAIRVYDALYADRSANNFYNQATEKGDIKSIPEIPGIAVWKKGHIGLYIGNGEVIEFKGTNYGCVKTKLSERPFTNWCKIREVDYSEPTVMTTASVPVLKQGCKGESVKTVQILLKDKKLLDDRADGIFGPNTKAAVVEFQHFYGLTEDGIVGTKTWERIING